MKKVLSLLALLVVVLFSCTKDDSNSNGDVSAIQKTSITAVITNTASTAKDVKRGTIIPVWVDKVTLTASNPIATWSVSETYNIVPDATPGASTNFVLDNVALGVNNFSASSTTNTTGILEQVSIGASGDLTAYSNVTARNPYVEYLSDNNSGNQGITIVAGGANLVTFGMKPQHGRSMAMFQWDPISPLTGYTAQISAVATKAGGGSAGTLAPTVVSPTNSTYVYWSDAFAKTGARIDYTIRIYSGTTLISTLYRSYTLNNGDSNSCIYTINKDNVLDNQKNFVMAFTPMNNTNVCGYDLDGYDFCSKKDNHGHRKEDYNDKGHAQDGCVHGGEKGSNHKD